MSKGKVTHLEPIVYGDYCTECEELGRKTKYDQPLEKDELLSNVFKPAGVFNIRGVGGTGKSFFLNSLIWNLLHNRTVEYHFITNFRYDQIIERIERNIIVGGKERTVPPRVVTEFIPASKIHPRLYEADDMASAWVHIGRILADIEKNPRPVRICLMIDEAPLTKMAGGRSTQGGTGGVTSTAAGMVSLVTVSRKVELLLFMAGWDETLFQRKFRSGLDDKEGTIEGLVHAVFSKNETDILTIASGRWPGKKGKKLSQRFRLGPHIEEYAAFIPTGLQGAEPSLIHVTATPLCKRESDCQVGDTTYSNKNIGGMDMGKIPSTNTPFSNDKLFAYLRNVPQRSMGKAILKFLHSETLAEKIDSMLPPDSEDIPEPPKEPDEQQEEPIQQAPETKMEIEEPQEPDVGGQPKFGEDKTASDGLSPEGRAIKRMQNEGVSFSEIVRRIGCARNTVKAFIKRHP